MTDEARRADLRAARKSIGMTQAALAARLGLSINTVAAYERGYWPNKTPASAPPWYELALSALTNTKKPAPLSKDGR